MVSASLAAYLAAYFIQHPACLAFSHPTRARSMLSFFTSHPVRLCDGLTRREVLTVGSLGAFGLTLPTLLQARAATPVRKPKACILLFLLGAPPQQETWDPKPDSPVEARGDMGVIRTATPGLIIGETMVKTSRLTEKIAILRACQTNDNAHSASGYFMTTGVPHQPMQVENAKPGAPNDWPSMGAVVRKVLQPFCTLPAAVTLPEQTANDGNLTWPGQDAGFLGRASDPWLITCEPEKPKFDIPGLALPADVSATRFDGRKDLLEALSVSANRDREGAGGSLQSHPLPHGRGSPKHSSDGAGVHTQRAFEMISSPAARKAFDLDSEDAQTRDRYGRTRFG